MNHQVDLSAPRLLKKDVGERISMKATIGCFTVDIYPTLDEVRKYCKVGQGAETCIWLLIAKGGWTCAALNRPEAAGDRKPVSKQDRCEKIVNFNPSGLDGQVEF